MATTPTPRRFLAIVAAVAVALGAVACSGSDDAEVQPEKSQQVLVFAAASLTAPLTELGDAYMAEHPEADIVLSFTGSNTAATQIIEGAPAAVLATADQATMKKVIDNGDIASATTFATNKMAILVAPENPEKIETLSDLEDDDLRVVLCAPEVPCGAYAAEVLDGADVSVSPRSVEANVNGVVTKVVNQAADAGLVYATDVIKAGNLAAGVEIPDDENVVVEYQIATVGDEPSETASGFVEFVTGSKGSEVLTKHGFGLP